MAADRTECQTPGPTPTPDPDVTRADTVGFGPVVPPSGPRPTAFVPATADPDATVAGGDAEVSLDFTLGPATARMPRFLEGYEVLDELARGGMGVVYRARQVHLGRMVALKIIRDPSIASLSDLKRFRSEAEAVARLEHPNIVPIYEVGQANDLPYFSMRLIEGGNLDRHLVRLKKEPAASAAIMAKVARAVHYAHQRAILHRDLKPSNVLLDHDDEPFVVDFGLAKHIADDALATESPTLTGAVMGTPAYMPPEQARGDTKVLTTAADIYSLGATFFEMLTGRAPFVGDSAAVILRGVLEQEPPRPRQLNPELDRDLETICLKCLQKDPSRRYGTAAELADDLDRWSEGRPITARPVSTTERVVKWARRRPALTALLLITHLALLGLVIGGVYFTRNLQRALTDANLGRYATDMNLARFAWDGHEVYRARDLLETYRDPEHGLDRIRGFEWFYLWRLCDRDPVALAGHARPITAVAYSPDGTWLASSSLDGTARVWDPERRTTERVLQGHTAGVTCLAYLDGGKRLATGSLDRTVRVWDVSTGRVIHSLPHPRVVRGLAVSPDGASLAVYTDAEDRIFVWDLATGQSRFVLARNEAPPQTSPSAISPAASVAYGPDGTRLYSSDFARYGVTVWDLATRAPVGHVPVEELITSLSVSADGKKLATMSSTQKVQIWDLATNRAGAIQPGFTYASGAIERLAFAPDGLLLALTATYADASQIWDMGTGRKVDDFAGLAFGGAPCLAFHPDGTRLAGSRGNDVAIVRLRFLEEVAPLVRDDGAIRALAVPADRSWLAWSISESPALRVRDLSGKGPIRTLDGHTLPVLALAAGPASAPHLLASASADGSVRLWDTRRDGPAWKVLAGHPGGASHVAFLRDGRGLVSSGMDGSVRVWDVGSGKLLSTIAVSSGPVLALAVHETTIVAASDSAVGLWDARTGRRLLGPVAIDGLAADLTIDPSGSRLVAALRTRRGGDALRMLDMNSGATLAVWSSPSRVRSVLFTPEGQRVITAGNENELIVWDPASGRETLRLSGHEKPPLTLVPGPGLSVYSAGLDGTARLWEGLDPGPRATAETRSSPAGSGLSKEDFVPAY
jgi:WD40 repeat protein/tRNA A-37 threonylcarbamoyl transferase component Bud32